MKWQDLLPGFVTQQWDKWFKKVDEALVYFTPAYVSKENSLFSPLIAVVALIAAIFLFGLAIGSFFTLFSSLLILYFILTRVFGIHLNPGDIFTV